MPEEDLGAIDVADAREHGLVHEQSATEREDFEMRAQATSGWASGRKGRAEAVQHGVDLLRGGDLAEVGAAQVGDVLVGAQPQPHGADGRHLGGPLVRVDGEAADEAEVHVQPAVVGELDEQVLAPAGGPEQLAAVELRGALRELALRAGDLGCRAGEDLVEVASEGEQRVAFGHDGSVGGGCRVLTSAGRRGPVASTVENTPPRAPTCRRLLLRRVLYCRLARSRRSALGPKPCSARRSASQRRRRHPRW